jgi:Zn/Cd-binding protein ZinT
VRHRRKEEERKEKGESEREREWGKGYFPSSLATKGIVTDIKGWWQEPSPLLKCTGVSCIMKIP